MQLEVYPLQDPYALFAKGLGVDSLLQDDRSVPVDGLKTDESMGELKAAWGHWPDDTWIATQRGRALRLHKWESDHWEAKKEAPGVFTEVIPWVDGVVLGRTVDALHCHKGFQVINGSPAVVPSLDGSFCAYRVAALPSGDFVGAGPGHAGKSPAFHVQTWRRSTGTRSQVELLACRHRPVGGFSLEVITGLTADDLDVVWWQGQVQRRDRYDTPVVVRCAGRFDGTSWTEPQEGSPVWFAAGVDARLGVRGDAIVMLWRGQELEVLQAPGMPSPGTMRGPRGWVGPGGAAWLAIERDYKSDLLRLTVDEGGRP